jgi:opacity protein-like surface antigen
MPRLSGRYLIVQGEEMKRIVSGVVAALLFLTMNGLARAEEGKAEGVEVTAGVKAWMNQWKQKDPVESRTSSDVMLIGPAIEIVCPIHFFVEASYLMSLQDYKFSQVGGDIKISRTDLDLAAGYMFNHNIGAFVGYRNSEFKEKETSAKETLSGGLLGIRGSVPVNEAFSVFGKATYLFTTLKTDTTSEQAPGWIAEAGVKYAFTKAFAGALGYKYETTKGKDSKIEDTFSGATLDVTYTF